MSDAQPWTNPQLLSQEPRYTDAKEQQEFEKAKELYTKAWNARNQDPENAKKLFGEAANCFERCNMPGLARKARSYS